MKKFAKALGLEIYYEAPLPKESNNVRIKN